MKNLLFVIIIILPVMSVAQITNLQQMRIDHEIENSQRLERVSAYSKENNIPIIRQSDSGITIYLKDVINGVPLFIKTDNIGAAVSTGADKIGIEGELGLELGGEGVAVAIWDGGAVRPTHNELTGRITLSDASPNFNFHATHVAGTILSKGINASSRGMAVNASAKTFDFNNDDSEMLQNAKPDQSGTILSNHSYGSVSGWDDGEWFGDPDISEDEDWKFGFYTSGAALWDEIAHNSPYYTIVKSAGNDRGDSGNGTHPADGPYDIISTNGTAKNIITIGAVQKLTEYTQPLDVVMSSFSGWGPTDDGRIKPDFVAAGVSLFSTFETADDAYGSLSGTSMSAPNATGTFVLLQQLHKKLTGSFMKSALLKGLVAHTAHEAGSSDGPDYSFGWGLVNATDAADILIKENGFDTRIEEIDLSDGSSYSFDINPEIGKKVKATICWTDPAGTVLPISLDPTELMLVNDLDMRISNVDETHEPWILDPATPAVAATTGDNFRDNIEVIEFIPTSENYSLTISHKNTLANNSQTVFLILTYEDINNSSNAQYWIGNDDDFSLSSNWSSETGGSGDGQSPSELTSLIFDNNSFDSGNSTINLAISATTTVNDFIYLSNRSVIFDLGNNDLIVKGKISLNDSIQFQGTGKVIFDSSGKTSVNIGSSLRNIDVQFINENGDWVVNDDFVVSRIDVDAGSVDFSGNIVEIEDFAVNTTAGKSVKLDSASIKIGNSVDLVSDNFTFSDSGVEYILFGDNVSISAGNVASNGNFSIEGTATIAGITSLGTMDIAGTLNIENSLEVDSLAIGYGSIINLSDQAQFTIAKLNISGDVNDGALIFNSIGQAAIAIPGHRKLCFEDLTITNVNLVDDGASVSVGVNSQLTNSSGWVEMTCENTIFADFDVQFNCESSLVLFTNNSSGNFENVSWDFDGLSQSEDTDGMFEFPSQGIYTITLDVSNNSDSDSYALEVEIMPNDLDDIEIVETGDNSLFSIQLGNSYQWFRNGEPIEGATERSYNFTDDGEHYVILYGDNCNRASNVIDITITGLSPFNNQKFIYPNPTSDKLFLSESIYLEPFSAIIYDLSGKIVHRFRTYNNQEGLDISNIKKGIYTVMIELEDSNTKVLRLIIN